VDYFGRKKFMEGAEAAAGENELPAYLRIAATHEAQQLDLLLGVRREIGMPAFGGHHAVAATVPHQKRLAETGAGGDQRPRSARLGLTGIEDAEIFRGEMLDTVTGGTEVIQQNDVRNTELFDEAGGIDDPRKIRSSHAAVDHRSGDAKAGCNDAFLAQMIGGLVREFLNDALESRELFARKALLEDRREGTAFFGEERQITLRAANVPCKDHLFPLPLY